MTERNATRDLDALAVADQATTPALNVHAMRLIHGRAPDGYIALERKLPDGKLDLQNRCFLPVAELNEMLPGIVEHYSQDGYHGISVYFGAAPWTNKTTGLRGMVGEMNRRTGKPYPMTWRRCKQNLKYLPTCFTDLDCGRTEAEAKRPEQALSWRHVAAEAGDLMDQGIIPQATIIARSGRGVYLFWLLCDEKNRRTVPRAHNFNVGLMEAINRELNNRTLHLAADRGAHDATRLCRIDGSWHSGAARRVRYLEQIPPDLPLGYIQRDENGRHYIYTLGELAGALSIPAIPARITERTELLLDAGEKYKRGPETRTHARKTKRPGSNPSMVIYQQRLYAKRMADLLALEQYRIRQSGHGFVQRGRDYPDGFVASVYGRRMILTIYAECFKRTGETIENAIERVRAMANNCYPRYPSDANDTPVDKLVQEVYSNPVTFDRRHDKLCRLLGITSEIAEAQHLETLIPPELKAQRKALKPTRDEYTQARRDALVDLVERYGLRPFRGMANLLAVSGLSGAINPVNNKPWSRETIRQDYIALEWTLNPLGRPVKRQ